MVILYTTSTLSLLTGHIFLLETSPRCYRNCFFFSWARVGTIGCAWNSLPSPRASFRGTDSAANKKGGKVWTSPMVKGLCPFPGWFYLFTYKSAWNSEIKRKGQVGFSEFAEIARISNIFPQICLAQFGLVLVWNSPQKICWTEPAVNCMHRLEGLFHWGP